MNAIELLFFIIHKIYYYRWTGEQNVCMWLVRAYGRCRLNADAEN